MANQPSVLFLLLASVVAWSEIGRAQVDILPEGEPVIATVVHGIKYPLQGRVTVDISMARYSAIGSQVLGALACFRNIISLKNSGWLCLFMHISRARSMACNSIAISFIVATDPGYTLALDLGYDPIYGKFVLGDGIHHFRSGLNAGIIGLQMNEVIGTAPLANGGMGSLGVGLQAGAQLQLQLNAHWTMELFSTLIGYRFQGLNTSADHIGWLYGLNFGRVF